MTAAAAISVTFPLTATELVRWSKFAQTKGGIGKARAIVDRMAGGSDDLMYLEGDEIIVLAALESETYLGWCEQVVGRFSQADVVFTTKLKKPVLSPRAHPSPAPVPPVPTLPLSFPLPPSSPPALAAAPPLQSPSRRSDRIHPTDPFPLTPARPTAEPDETVPKRRERTVSSGSDNSSIKSRRRMGLAILTARDGDFGEMPRWDEALLHYGSPTGSPKTFSPSVSTIHSTPQLDFSASPDPSSDSGHEIFTPPTPQWQPPTPTSPRSPRSPHHSPRSYAPSTPISPLRKTVSQYSSPARLHSLSSPTSKSPIRPSPPPRRASSPSPPPSTTTPSTNIETNPPKPERPPLRSQFSDVSLADSRYSRATKASEGPSIVEEEEDVPIMRSAFSAYSPGGSSIASTHINFRKKGQSMESSWSRSRSEKGSTNLEDGDDYAGEDDDDARTTSTFGGGGGTGLRGEVTEQLFSSIFDLYSTTTPAGSSNAGSGLNSIIGTPAPISPSPFGTKPGGASASGRKKKEFITDEVLVEEPEVMEDHQLSSSRYEGLAYELRERLAVAAQEEPRGGVPHPHSLRDNSTSEYDQDEIEIPRLSSIFPRHSTVDSNYLPSSAHSSRTPSPDPEHPNPSRRLFQTYISPPRLASRPLESRGVVVGLPDSPIAVTIPSIVPPPRTTSESPKRVKVAPPMLATAPLTWRSRDALPKRMTSSEADPSSFPSSPATPPRVPSPSAIITSAPAPANGPFPNSASYYDDANAPPMRHWMPKLTVPSNAPHTGIDYSLRVPPSPVASSIQTSSNPSTVNMSVWGHNSSPSDTTSSSIAPPPHSSLPRSQSAGSLRDGPTKLRKNNLRIKTSEALLKAGMAEAAISMTGSASFSSANDLDSMRFQPSPAGQRTPTDSFDMDPSPMSAMGSSGMVKSHSMFNFGRKTSQSKEKESKPKANYGAAVSSKDFEPESVTLGKAEFDIVKPLAALLLNKDDDATAFSHMSRPSVSSMPSNDHTMDLNLDSDDGGEADTPIGAILTSPTQHKFEFGRSSTSLHDQLPSSPSSQPNGKAVESHRAKELTWVKTLSLSAPAVKKSNKVKSLVKAGIPSSVRGRVWSFLVEAHLDKVEGLYHSLASMETPRMGLEQDVARTVQGDPQFAPNEPMWDDLLSVVRALTFYDSELTRYDCMASVASLLLTQVPAEEAFYVMVSLVRRYNLHVFFSSPTPQLALECVAFQNLLEGAHPKLHAHLTAQGLDARAFLPRWQSTLFSPILPLSIRLRIADLIFFDSTYLLRTSLAIMELVSPRLLESPTAESAIRYLHNIPASTLSSTLLLPTVFTIKLKDDKVKKAYRKAETTLVKSGTMRKIGR